MRHPTRVIWLATVSLAALLAACGDGRVIFNVDVLSFLKSSAQDTFQYSIPVPIPDTTVSSEAQEVSMLAIGSSTVESVTVAMAAEVQNQAGSGRIRFQIFFDTSQATVFNGLPRAQDSVDVTGVDVDTLGPLFVPLGGDTLFRRNQVWVGVRLRVGVTSAPFTGQVRLTTLGLRIVVQDELF